MSSPRFSRVQQQIGRCREQAIRLLVPADLSRLARLMARCHTSWHSIKLACLTVLLCHRQYLDRKTHLLLPALCHGMCLSISAKDLGAVYCDVVRLPIAGRVSMDSITIDITALPENHLRPGILVEVIGPHQTLEDIARDADTISHEILIRLGHRYQRTYC